MFKACLGAALLMIAALPALATTVLADFTGTVSDGEDVTGLFGSPGTELDGASFTLSFVYDTDVGYRTTILGEEDTVRGDPFLPVTEGPVSSAVLTIAGVSQVVPTEYSSGVLAWLGGTQFDIYVTDYLSENDGGLVTTSTVQINAKSGAGLLPTSLEVSTTLAEADSIGGQFFFAETNYDTPDPFGIESRLAFGYFDVETALVMVNGAEPTPVPLPASGFLLLAALGGVGAAGWRRRRAA